MRIAFGAHRRDIYKLVAQVGAWPLGGGLAVGLALYVVVAGTLQRLVTGPGGLAIYFWRPVVVGAGITMVLITVAVAIWLPARRATRTDPVAALREE